MSGRQVIAAEQAARIPEFAGKKLLIFDLDGTIADSTPLHAQAFNETFAPFGIAVDYDRIAGLTTGLAVARIAEEAGLTLSAEQVRALVDEKRERAARLIETRLEPLDGSLDFLRNVRDLHLLSLCTSASRGNARASLDRLGIADCFDSVFAAEDVLAGKPAPDLFLSALRRHDASPGDAIVFEDSDAGIAAAHAAAIDVIRIVRQQPADGEATWAMLNATTSGAR